MQPQERAEPEKCDLCGEPVPAEHRHLIDLSNRRILCGCRACCVLFDHKAAGGGHYRLLPERRRYLDGFELDDDGWTALGLPIELAFFFYSGAAGRVVAFYPGPMGAVESALKLEAWQHLLAANPVLGEMEPDVEALLVNRSADARDHWLVPVDECYRLVGLIRLRWRGLSGGQEVWEEIGQFFDELRRRSERVSAADGSSRPTATAVGDGKERA